MVICAACIHNPGRGALCNAGNRHATAAPKQCAEFVPGVQARRVRALRGAARAWWRLGAHGAHVHLLKAAHREAAR